MPAQQMRTDLEGIKYQQTKVYEFSKTSVKLRTKSRQDTNSSPTNLGRHHSFVLHKLNSGLG